MTQDTTAWRRGSAGAWVGVGLLCALLAACGGGGGAGGDGSTTAASAPTGVPLTVGRRISYQVVDTDNSSNSMTWQLDHTVLSLAVDGSYTESTVGNGGQTVVNGTRYGTVNQVVVFNAAHQVVSYMAQGNPAVLCNYGAPVPGLPVMMPLGLAWPEDSSHVDCSNGAAFDLHLLGGSSVADETVTVASGTFAARKVRFVQTTTITASGVQRKVDVTAWYDHASNRLVRSETDYTYTAVTQTAGYLVHESMQLLTPP